MKRVWKYQLEVKAGYQTIQMPSGAEILSVHSQKKDYLTKKPCIWCLVNPENVLTERTIVSVGTGKVFSEYTRLLKFIGTYQIDDDFEVMHVFEKPRQ